MYRWNSWRSKHEKELSIWLRSTKFQQERQKQQQHQDLNSCKCTYAHKKNLLYDAVKLCTEYTPLNNRTSCTCCLSFCIKFIAAKCLSLTLRHHYGPRQDRVVWRVMAPQKFKTGTLWFYKGKDSTNAHDVTFHIQCLRKFHAVNAIFITISTDRILHSTMGTFIRSAYTRLKLEVKSV